MKLVILTSDIHDGVIISQNILRSGKDVKAIIYEKKGKTLRSSARRILFKLSGVMEHMTYGSMSRMKQDMIVKEVEDINSETVLSLLKEISPDLIVVIGTRKLKREIFDQAKLGAINMHAGILPYYRGADSEFWALYNGEEDKVGVSIHFIDEELDSGDILLQAHLEVNPGEDHIALRRKNILLGAEKMVEAITLVESGRYEKIKQDEEKARTYKSATKGDIEIFKRARNLC